MAGMAGWLAADRAQADGLFRTKALAENSVARHFKPMPPDLKLPDVKLQSAAGWKSWRDLMGQPALVAVWAEWCAPCLAEARDLAVLQRRYDGKGITILSLLSHSAKKLDLDGARALLARMDADSLPLWIEPDGGDRVASSLTRTETSPVDLPCVLLFDKGGRVRARSLGFVMQPQAGMQLGRHTLDDDEKDAMLNMRSEWAGPDGDAFVRALCQGALED
jgi:thiol-disulfide isomerase/thioredoxin